MLSPTMPKKIQKFFHHCLSKLKNSRPQIHPASSSSSSPIMRILSGCKQPKTPSFAVSRGNDDDAATLSDVDRFLFENFKSLFLDDDENTTGNNNINNVTIGGVPEEKHGGPITGSDPFDPMSPDLLGDVTESSGSRESIVLLAWSANQYEDFRRSMKEMVESRLRNHERVDWGFLEELLLCYLNLNEKKSHKFILSAYVDLVHGLRESSSEKAPATAKPKSVRTIRTGREIGRSKVAIRGIEKQD